LAGQRASLRAASQRAAVSAAEANTR